MPCNKHVVAVTTRRLPLPEPPVTSPCPRSYGKVSSLPYRQQINEYEREIRAVSLAMVEVCDRSYHLQ